MYLLDGVLSPQDGEAAGLRIPTEFPKRLQFLDSLETGFWSCIEHGDPLSLALLG